MKFIVTYRGSRQVVSESKEEMNIKTQKKRVEIYYRLINIKFPLLPRQIFHSIRSPPIKNSQRAWYN